MKTPRLLTSIALGCAVAAAIAGCKRSHERNEPLVEVARACARDAEMSCPRPVLHVADFRASQRYYHDVLGFHLDWDHGEPADFGAVSRGDTVLFLCHGCISPPGAWTMVFTAHIDRLHDELAGKGAIIREPPTDKPWGLREMQVADPDGNVLRFGSAIDE
jgi:catechol 2,3-dioxygenase-like lactoylglutathione lyase family enzyme